MVRRQRVQRRGHPDELPRGGGTATRRSRREPPEADGVPEEDPRAPGVPAGARARRALQLRARLSDAQRPACSTAGVGDSKRAAWRSGRVLPSRGLAPPPPSPTEVLASAVGATAGAAGASRSASDGLL